MFYMIQLTHQLVDSLDKDHEFIVRLSLCMVCVFVSGKLPYILVHRKLKATWKIEWNNGGDDDDEMMTDGTMMMEWYSDYGMVWMK